MNFNQRLRVANAVSGVTAKEKYEFALFFIYLLAVL